MRSGWVLGQARQGAVTWQMLTPPPELTGLCARLSYVSGDGIKSAGEPVNHIFYRGEEWNGRPVLDTQAGGRSKALSIFR